MFVARVRRRGSSLVLTVPRREVERLGLTGGQLLNVEIRPLQPERQLAPDLRDAFDVEMTQCDDALRHLAG